MVFMNSKDSNVININVLMSDTLMIVDEPIWINIPISLIPRNFLLIDFRLDGFSNLNPILKNMDKQLS